MFSIDITVLKDHTQPVSKIADRLEPYLRVFLEEFSPHQVILFGSYAYGQPSEHSDVDLLVIKSGLHAQRARQEAHHSQHDSLAVMRRRFARELAEGAVKRADAAEAGS